MKKTSNEQPKTETNTPFEVETRISKEELNPEKFHSEEWEIFLTALRLLAKNKDENTDNVTLEIKEDPATGRRSAIVYKNSDHATVFMTENEIEINYLKNPVETLRLIETDLESRRMTDKLKEDIKNETGKPGN